MHANMLALWYEKFNKVPEYGNPAARVSNCNVGTGAVCIGNDGRFAQQSKRLAAIVSVFAGTMFFFSERAQWGVQRIADVGSWLLDNRTRLAATWQ